MTILPWLKLQGNIFENRKIKTILKLPSGESYFVIWIKLLCLALGINDSGKIYLVKGKAMDDETLSVLLDTEMRLLTEALKLFRDFSMILVDEQGAVVVKNWNEYQERPQDKTKEIREYNREAQRRCRARAKEKKLEEKTSDGSGAETNPKEKTAQTSKTVNDSGLDNGLDSLVDKANDKSFDKTDTYKKREEEMRKEEKRGEKNYSAFGKAREGAKRRDVSEKKEKIRYGDFDPQEALERALKRSMGNNSRL